MILACHRKTAHNKSTKNNTSQKTYFASYCPDKCDGKITTSGEKYRNVKFTAAHCIIAFGTLVTVKNISNVTSVTATINHRGPFVSGRIIDLSKAATKQIDILKAGIVKMHLLCYCIKFR